MCIRDSGYRGDLYGWNFVSDISTIIPHSHGTHVAGTIAAVNYLLRVRIHLNGNLLQWNIYIKWNAE